MNIYQLPSQVPGVKWYQISCTCFGNDSNDSNADVRHNMGRSRGGRSG